MNISSVSAFGNSTPINQIFDILPLSGRLEPGQVQDVQFIYNAQGGILYRATALCHVQGGPNYQVKLEGDSSLIGGKINQKQLDFGLQRFCEWSQKDIYIENTGKVTFQFKVSTQNVKKKPFLEVIPMNGKIAGGQKQKITIRICPATPQEFLEVIQIQMGYYDPQEITIRGVGVYPALLCQFPRSVNTDFDNKVKSQLDRYTKQYQVYIKKISKDKNKKKQKQMKSIQQYKQELQKEVDRQVYCKMIQNSMQTYIKPQNKPNGNVEVKLYQKIFLATWVCDFGNVIVGSTQKRVLKFKNVGDYLIEMAFDMKTIKGTEYNITPDKSKLVPGEEATITITLATKKTSKFGKLKTNAILELKSGAKYKVQLASNLTIPQIIIDENPDGIVDFGKVLCGQKKTVTLRFLNLKEISCDWSLNIRDTPGSDKDDIKFQLEPVSGKIVSGGFQIVKVSFTPSLQKDYFAKFPLKIQQNPKILNLDLKGFGTCINLQFRQPKIKIKPALPYDQKSFEVLDISNPSQYSTELTTLDFDKKFKEQMNLLSAYEQFMNFEKKDKERVVFLPIREPGSGIWPQVIKTVEKHNRIEEIKKKMQSANQQQKQTLEKQLKKLTQIPPQIQYPKKVDSENMLHLVVTGPPKSGKSHIAATIASLHQRAVVKFNQIIDWHLNSSTNTAPKITQYLSDRKKQFQLALQERQKAFKKAGKKAKQLEDKLGPANQPLYDYLPQQIWIEAIKERIKHPQCNAGCVFDNLYSKHLSNQLVALNLIMKAVGPQAVDLIELEGIVASQKKEDDGKSEYKKSQISEPIQKSPSKATLNVIAQVQKEEQEQIRFQIKDFENEHQKQEYLKKQQNLRKLIKNQLQEQPKLKMFRDPIFQDAKNQQKQDALGKVSGHIGNRDIIHMPIYCNSLEQKNAVKKYIPKPVYRDPMKQPLPPPFFQQVIFKNTNKPFETKLLKQFQILTPKDRFNPYQKTQKKQQKKDKRPKKEKTLKSDAQPEYTEPLPQFKIQELSKQTRWIIAPETTLRLYIRFFSKVPSNFESQLTFENTYTLKKNTIPITAKTQFPSLANVPKTLFWNLKRTRPTTCPQNYLSKTFVISQNCFDFGPLLIGKSQDKKNQKTVLATNSTTFRLVNSGTYNTQIEVALLSSVIQNQPAYKKGVFSVSADKFTIAPNQAPRQLRVWAIPDDAKNYSDDLIIMIKDNPTPLTIPLRCLGSKPKIDIIQGSPMKFTRILLKQVIKRYLKLKNPTAIPIKFQILGCESLPQQFSITVKQGRLKPNEQTSIQVVFKAIKQQKFNQVLKLVAEDVENMQIVSQTKQIAIQAEAFDISVDMKFPNDNTENLLDFGAIRVGDFKDQIFTVKNIGLYNVKLSFVMTKKQYKQSFKIEPMQLQLQPNNSKQILIRFSSLKELKLKTNNNTSDIIMEILQGKTSETHRSVPINVSVNAVFSNYSIVPLKNMNFGPIQFNQNKTRTFEIKNQGLFQFNFSIFDYNNEQFRKELMANIEKQRQLKLQAANTLPAPGVVDPKKGGKKQAKQVKKQPPKKAGKGGKGQPQNALKIQQWTISPSNGVVAPQSSITIQVNFAGKGQKLFEQKIGVDIENRNPNDQPKGILYELIAQSCIPGINTTNFENIFEQQLVMPSQHHSSNISGLVKSNVFYAEERIFNFGTLVPSKVPDGITEKIKIQNSNKVPCSVKFDVKKKNPNAPQQFAFEVSPKQIKIPAHEHQYIGITFKPTIMAAYAGVFEAIVDNGDQQPRTHKLTFDLKGEGALPTLRVQKPKQYLDQRTMLLKFPKTRLGKNSIQQISLKNDGNIPATVKFELTPNDSFKFIDNSSITITPKSYSVFNVQFLPATVGIKQWDINALTLLNQFQTMRFKIQGQAYFEDYLLQNLPLQQEDKIDFDDCVINQQKKINFMLRNNLDNVAKFQWNLHQDFIFLPRIGHIAPKSSKSITVSFKSKKTVVHKEVPINCQICQVRQSSEDYNDWDDSMTVRKFVTKTYYDWMQKKIEQQKKLRQEEAQLAKKGGKKDNKKAPKKQQKKQQDDNPPLALPGQQADIMIQQVIPQPQNALLEKTQKSLTLKLSGVSDYTKYQIQQKIVDFLPTMMYTSRVHKIALKNISKIKMPFQCKIVSAETGKIDSGFFSVSPHAGSILPGCNQSFTIKFSPTEVQQINARLLVISLKHLDPQQQKLIVQLNGDIQRPICHFELPPSKYREKKPDLQAKYNVIEFESLGTKVKNTKRFYVINPTSLAYDFEWKKIDDNRDSNSGFFRCINSKGTILSGKKAQMIFEYTPDLVGNHQSYWIFEIPSEKITQFFLVVGNVIEPNVFFDVGKVNFGPLLLGGKNKQIVSLKNLQDVPLAYSFERESIKGQQDYGNSLSLQPISGVIPSQGQTKVEIVFQPRVAKEFNYNIICNIKRKSRPICVNIKGIGYVLNHSVYLNNKPLVKGQKSQINFGNIFVNESKQRSILIENSGDFNFDFAVKTSHDFPYLKVSNQFGTVKKSQKFTIDLDFHPQDQFAFKANASLTLSIISGPTYTFILRGTAKKPGIDFSFYSYDFGPCFVLKQPLSIVAELEIRNREATAISIQTLYQKSHHLDVKIPSGQVVLPVQILSVKNKKGVLERVQKNVLKIPIVFTPRQLIKYNQVLTFDINQLNKIQVKIKGQGIPLKLEVEKTEDQNVDFGVIKVGHDATRIVNLVNHSKKKIQITFDVDKQLEELKKNFITVIPQGNIIINPRQKLDLQISFRPTTRVSPFKTQLFYKIIQNQQSKKLLNIFTTAHGIEMRLMEDTVGFGTVVVNSKMSKNIQLSNFGDIGSKFEWDTTFCGKYFTITPQKGYLIPHQDLLFDITFHPNVPDNDIRFKVKCTVEGTEPLFVNLVGKCIPQPNQAVQQLKFESMVRKKVVQKVTLKNPTLKPWKIKASISSDDKYQYFEGKQFVEVPANGQADYQITYYPLTMTKNQQVKQITEQKHIASLFFPIPDGSALMYKLIGKSTPPAILDTYDLATKAKINLVHIIPIKNWLKSPQRFNVSWKFQVEQKSVFINAATIFDVGGDSVKDYRLSIYALKNCQVKFTLIFRNPNTNQFLSYKINLAVSPSDPMKLIELSSLVRQTTSKLITIDNPLSHPIQIKKQMITVQSDVVFVSPNAFTIPAKSEFGVQFIFRPLLAKEENTRIIIKSQDLGQFAYPLKLIGNPSTSQRTMNFKTSLGTQLSQKFKFIHYGKKPTVYNCRVQKVGQKSQIPVDPKAKVPAVNSDFIVETATVNAPGAQTFQGVQVSVNVKFEPSTISESISQLIISSPDSGQYLCTLNGYATAPQPKGPFKITAKPPPIDFKNPFFDAYQFTVRIDNPAFTSSVKSPVKVDGKKVLSINLTYKAIPGGTANGRLTISAGDNLSWVFYLQGQ